MIHHDPVTNISDIVETLGLPMTLLVKVMLFKTGSTDRFVVAAIRGNDTVDIRKLSLATRVPRRHLSLVDREQLPDLTGTPLGAIKPYGYDDRFTVIFDRSVMSNKVVFCSAGTNTDTLIIQSSDLLKISKGKIHSIAKDPKSFR